MKNKIFTLIIIAFIINGCGFSSERKQKNNKSNNYKKDTIMIFSHKILAIEKKVVDLTSPSDLFMFQDFIKIYEKPNLYKESALDFISQRETTEQQKTITLYSMHNLDIQNYLDIIRTLYNLFLKDEIKVNLLEMAITYPFSQNHLIISNFDNSDVRQLLNQIRNTEEVSNKFKLSIDNILSGKTWKKIKKFKKNSGH